MTTVVVFVAVGACSGLCLRQLGHQLVASGAGPSGGGGLCAGAVASLVGLVKLRDYPTSAADVTGKSRLWANGATRAERLTSSRLAKKSDSTVQLGWPRGPHS